MSEEFDDLLLFTDTKQAEEEEQAAPAAWEDEEDIERENEQMAKIQEEMMVDDEEMKKIKEITKKRQQKKKFEDIWKKKEIENLDENELQLLKPTITRNERGGRKKQNNEIEYHLLKHSMHVRKSNDIITSTQFNVSRRMILSCGRDRYIHLFKLTNKDNVVSIYDEEMNDPIEYAKFVDQSVMMTFNKQFIKFMDIETHKITTIRKIGDYQCDFGDFYVGEKYIALINAENLSTILLDKTTKQVVEELKGSKQILCATFHPKEDVYITAGGSGVCNIWDLKTMRCKMLVHDEGTNYTTAIAISQDGQYIATGSIGGIVNLYEYKTFEKESYPKPIHVFKNLTTDCDHLVFKNGMLLMSSSKADNQIRLANVQQKIVYSNLPGWLNFKRVQEIDISPHGGYLVFGNSTGEMSVVNVGFY